MKIYPRAWVMPGGAVDAGESFEETVRREVEEEVGLSDFKSVELVYLYESCTRNVIGINGKDEKFPPKSQHLVPFFKV